MTTPAETLRTAASRLRQLADAAKPGPWADKDSPLRGSCVGTAEAWVAFCDDPGDEPQQSRQDAAYIAVMHPGVGRALADWLETVADEAEKHARGFGNCQTEITDVHPIAVARAVLGETAPQDTCSALQGPHSTPGESADADQCPEPSDGRTAARVHASPPPASGLTPCCGRTPFELPRGDRMTADPDRVTCRPN